MDRSNAKSFSVNLVVIQSVLENDNKCQIQNKEKKIVIGKMVLPYTLFSLVFTKFARCNFSAICEIQIY